MSRDWVLNQACRLSHDIQVISNLYITFFGQLFLCRIKSECMQLSISHGLRHLIKVSACLNILVPCFILFLSIDFISFDIKNVYLRVRIFVLTHLILIKCFFDDCIIWYKYKRVFKIPHPLGLFCTSILWYSYDSSDAVCCINIIVFWKTR